MTHDNNNLKKRMLAYSAKKIKANVPDLYSVLNPDTSSDSPSAKSKGVRLVSTTHKIKSSATSGNLKIINFLVMFNSKEFKRDVLVSLIAVENKITVNETS